MKFSIVTPAWNVGPWLSETIESVISQSGEFDLEYTIVSDPSSDDTVAVARRFDALLSQGNYKKHCNSITFKLIELTGSGSMYIALNTGFEAATGEVHAWIPGDDVYQPGAFEAMRKIFETFKDVQWVKGYDGIINEEGQVITEGASFIYYQPWIQAGIYGMEAYHVSQETSFWRASLWKQHGPFPSHMKSMGDYWLWLQFSKTTRLWSADVPISYFRKRPGQDSRLHAKRCRDSMWHSRGNRRPVMGWIARLYFYPYTHFLSPRMKRFAGRLYPLIFPHHPLWYIALEGEALTMRRAKSFVCRWPVEYNGSRTLKE